MIRFRPSSTCKIDRVASRVRRKKKSEKKKHDNVDKRLYLVLSLSRSQEYWRIESAKCIYIDNVVIRASRSKKDLASVPAVPHRMG